MNLTSPKDVTALLERRGIRPNKTLGQNFLIDRNILDLIVEGAELKGTEHVLEVGAGLGVLTERLLDKAAHVTAVEKDAGLYELLEERWGGDGRLLFLIKALGDYTRTLGHALRVGDAVTVEGPYGRFQFNGQAQRQVWIGAGIGVTPFVARMQALAVEPDGRAVDFFHVTADVDERALALLRADAQAAGVRLHVIVSGRGEQDERFTGERLRALAPDWLQADVWFCGPAAFGDALSEDLVAHGLAPGSFHRELFEMR